MTSPQKDPENEKWATRYIQAAGWAISLWGLCITVVVWRSYSIDGWEFTKAGQFGDSMGVVNALFSGLAFAALIVTMLMQRDELKLQRKEMSETRSVMEAQREQMAEQNRVSAEAALLAALPLVIEQLSTSYMAQARHDDLNPIKPLSSLAARRLAKQLDEGIVHMLGAAIPNTKDYDARIANIQRHQARSDLLHKIAERFDEIEKLYDSLSSRTIADKRRPRSS